MEVVAQNSEATLAFRALAAAVMRFVAGDEDIDLYKPMLRCVDGFDSAGGPLSIVDFTPQMGDQDYAINLIVQGVLRMVASAMETQNTTEEEYQRGLSSLSHGVMELNRKLQAAKRGNLERITR